MFLIKRIIIFVLPLFFLTFQWLSNTNFFKEVVLSSLKSFSLFLLSGNCSWKYLSDGYSWNVALPDFYSKYHISILYFPSEDHIYEIQGNEIPYARYFSYQVYEPSIKHGNAIDSINDRQIQTDGEYNMNAYKNLTFARSKCRQGSYSIYISNDGKKGFTNEIQGLPSGQQKGWFILFLRLYILPEDKPPKTLKHCNMFYQNGSALIESAADQQHEVWGWVKKPKIFLHLTKVKVNNYYSENTLPMKNSRELNRYQILLQEIRYCEDRWNWNEKLFYFLRKILSILKLLFPTLKKPLRNVRDSFDANLDNNIYLPSYNDRIGTFNNHDARYIGGATDNVKLSKSFLNSKIKTDLRLQDNSSIALWASIKGTLPLTPGSLYEPPFIANICSYDIRYISISSGDRSFPLQTHSTINDNDIKRYYKNIRYANFQDDNSSYNNINFNIWIGPENSEIPFLAHKTKSIILRWPSKRSFSSSRVSQRNYAVDYPGFLIRQLYAVYEMDDKESCPISNLDQNKQKKSTVAEIIPKECSLSSNQCCGDKELKESCHLPEFLSSQLQSYYPKVTYYMNVPNVTLLQLN